MSAPFTALTVLLLAPNVSMLDLKAALDDHGADWFVREQGASGQLESVGNVHDDSGTFAAVRRAAKTPTPWKRLLSRMGLPLATRTEPDTESALVAVTGPTSDRHVIFCFGAMARSIPAHLTDARFGLIVALNKKCAGAQIPPWRTWTGSRRGQPSDTDPPGFVRRIKADARTGYRHRLEASANSAVPVAGLRLDIEVDNLKGLGVRTDDELMRELDAGRTLRFSTPIESLDHFQHLAEYLLQLRDRNDYRTDWEWIDHIVLVEPGPEYDQVIQTFIGRLGQPTEPHIELAMPLVFEDESDAQRILVAFPEERGAPCRVAPEWRELRKRLLDPKHTKDLRRVISNGYLRFALEGDTAGSIERCKIIDLLAAELDIDGRTYILDCGRVYRVEDDYLKKVDTYLSDIPKSVFPFPSYTGGTEPEYLNNCPQRSGHQLAVLDRRNIRLPGQSAFEPCDLVTDDATLVFVKPKGDSSAFSHLCVQAVASATMFVTNSEAREQLLDRVILATEGTSTAQGIQNAMQDRLLQLEKREHGTVTLCLLILGIWNGPPQITALPLLSRLALRKAVQEMRNLGYLVELALPATYLAGLTSSPAPRPDP